MKETTWINPVIDQLVRIKDKPEERTGMFRMDRNERTWPFPEAIIEEIRKSITSETFTNYPEIDSLYDEMAGYLDISSDELIFHTGSDLVIKSIFETYIQKDDKVLMPRPSYAMYSVYANMYQAEILQQRYDSNLRFDLEKYCERIKEERPKLVIIENPSGFIGNSYTALEVEHVIKDAESVNALIVVDEAYIDYIDESVLPLITKYPNLIIVRTMSKAWGLAGLRVGYAISVKENIRDLFKVKPMHQLTQTSVIATKVLLKNSNLISAYVAEVNQVREYFKGQLQKMEIETSESRTHFVTVKLGDKVCLDDFRACAREKKYLLRRPFSEDELNKWVRIGLLPMEHMISFSEFMEQYMLNWKGRDGEMDKVLIVGASSDLSAEVLPTLIDEGGGKIGLHYSSNKKAVEQYEDRENVKLIQCTIHDEEDCKVIVDDYVSWAGGIDGIVIFLGDISATCHWQEIRPEQLENEYRYNAVYPLILAKYAQRYMRKSGGRILFISTASVKRGGGSTTIGYGMAKAALECAMKRLARDLAADGILVNAIAPGFFDSKFNRERKKLSENDVAERVAMIPLKRGGRKEEIASCVLYMLSEGAGFITGQIITVDGGDFL